MEKTKWTLFPRRRPGWTGRLLLILIACGVPFAARAQTIRIAKQYGIAYLPLTVIRTQHLMEKLGRRQGLDLQTRWLQFTGGA
jgi:sulfonate transport system substrate-binding protein